MTGARWTETISTRIRHEQMQKIRDICEERDMKPAEWARYALNEQLRREGGEA